MVAVSASHFHRLGDFLVLSAREIMDVISACQQVGTYRGAAAICGVNHKTVKRVIERAEAGGKPPDRRPRACNYVLVAVLVAGRVAATPGRISAKRLLPAAGYRGSARNFRRLVACAKRARRQDNHRGRRPRPRLGRRGVHHRVGGFRQCPARR